MQWRVDDVQPHEDVVEQAITLQNIDPRIDAYQERRPERQHDRHDQHGLQPSVREPFHMRSDSRREEKAVEIAATCRLLT